MRKIEKNRYLDINKYRFKRAIDYELALTANYAAVAGGSWRSWRSVAVVGARG